MRRGTTPTHVFHPDIDLTGAEVIYITYQQCEKTVLGKEIGDITVEADSLTVKLTQAETLRFRQNLDAAVKIQIRARWADGDAVASNVIQMSPAGDFRGAFLSI